jgi:hypothetical protein
LIVFVFCVICKILKLPQHTGVRHGTVKDPRVKTYKQLRQDLATYRDTAFDTSAKRVAIVGAGINGVVIIGCGC